MAENRQKRGSISALVMACACGIPSLYQVLLFNKIGKEGMGYYGVAFSIYFTVFLLSSYVIPPGISKITESFAMKGQYRSSYRILGISLLSATVFGGFGAVVLWFLADFLSGSCFHMPYGIYSLKTLALVVFIMGYSGVLRGYLLGLGAVGCVSASLVFEQLVNAAASVWAAGFLYSKGQDSQIVFGAAEYPYAFGAAGGILGLGVGALSALLLLVCFLFMNAGQSRFSARFEKKGERRAHVRSGVRGFDRRQAERSFSEGNPPSLLVWRAEMHTLRLVAAVVFPYCLSDLIAVSISGSKITAMEWGVYFGQYLLITGVPMVFSNALSFFRLPVLLRATAAKRKRQAMRTASKCIRTSLLVTVVAALLLAILSAPLHKLLFVGDNSMAVRLTMMGSAAVILFPLSVTAGMVLSALNHAGIWIRNALISLSIHMAVLFTALYLFSWGIYGVLFAHIVFGLFLCILNFLSVVRLLRFSRLTGQNTINR